MKDKQPTSLNGIMSQSGTLHLKTKHRIKKREEDKRVI